MKIRSRVIVCATFLALSGVGCEDVAEQDVPSAAPTGEYRYEEYADVEEEVSEDEAGEAPSAMVERMAVEGDPSPTENPATDTAEDALATFSLDVDTASYTLMRRDITAGRLPAPQSVRVEEYVNFFDYEDEAPGANAETPFAVHLETAPHPFVDGARLMRVGARAEEVSAADRPATNLVFLVDVSGSMTSSEKIGLVQYSLRTLVDGLRPQDHVGIVVYAGSDAVLLRPTEVERRGAILEAIEGLRTGGSTHGAAGIRTAYDLAAEHLQPGGINRVVLCTDGDFNVGETGEALLRLIRQERERGITLTVLGYGRGGTNDRQMEQLADQGNGSYAFIDSPREALRVLSRDLEGTLFVVAGDVKVQVAFNRDVVSRYRLVGYENRVLRDRDFEDDTVDAAEIGSGDFVTAYLEYELQEGVDPDTDPREVAQVRLRYKDVGAVESTLRTYSMTLSDGESSFDEASRSFRFGAAVAEMATILRRGERSHPERMGRVIEIATASQNDSEDQAELIRLARSAQRLLQQ